MKLATTRITTADVSRLVSFYEQVTGAVAVWANELSAEIPTQAGTLAIRGHRAAKFFGAARNPMSSAPRTILEFVVDDVDAEYARLHGMLSDVIATPTTMPWGYRALLFRDPDGNLVTMLTPEID